MEASARRNCGYPGISPEECASRKCCFSDAIDNVPWCFFPIPVEGNVPVGLSYQHQGKLQHVPPKWAACPCRAGCFPFPVSEYWREPKSSAFTWTLPSGFCGT